jgi:hypothetical protein
VVIPAPWGDSDSKKTRTGGTSPSEELKKALDAVLNGHLTKDRKIRLKRVGMFEEESSSEQRPNTLLFVTTLVALVAVIVGAFAGPYLLA